MTARSPVDRWRNVMREGKRRNLGMWFDPAPAVGKKEILSTEKSLDRKLPVLLVDLLLCSRAWGWRDADYDVQFHEPDAIVRDTLEPAEEFAQIVVGVTNDERVKPYFYSPDRLTFAYSDNLRFQIDNDPAPGGKKGQIVATDHDEND